MAMQKVETNTVAGFLKRYDAWIVRSIVFVGMGSVIVDLLYALVKEFMR